jgi:hypothetical protein
MLPMSWLWIILRALFPRDPIRQGAEAIRQRVVQLVGIVNDDTWLQELLSDPAIRLQIELIILDAEDTLRLWIAMRGCQIAGIRLGVPHECAIPNLTRAKDLPELLARIYELLEACEKMEQRAQAHAERLKRLRDLDPLDIRTACGPLRHDASHRATSPAFGEGGLSSTGKAGGGGMRSMTEGGWPRSADAAPTRAPPYSIAGATP